jgi:YVTN family beta-propeller protein
LKKTLRLQTGDLTLVAGMNNGRKCKLSVIRNPSFFVFGVTFWLVLAGLAQTPAVEAVSQSARLPKNIVTATVPVGDSPFCAVVSPDSKTVYVSNESSNTVSVIDASTNTVIFTIPVPSGPDSLAITPDDQNLYVVCDGFGGVAVIDPLSDVVTDVLPAGENPGTIAVSPDGKSAALAGGSAMLFFDTATNELSSSIELGFPLDAYDLVFSPATKYAYFLTNTSSSSVESGLLRINLTSQRQRQLVWGE